MITLMMLLSLWVVFRIGVFLIKVCGRMLGAVIGAVLFVMTAGGFIVFLGCAFWPVVLIIALAVAYRKHLPYRG